MKRLYALFCLGVIFPVFAMADTIVLKNGMRFDSERIWEENGEIKGIAKGLIIGFPKNDVDHIEKAENQPEQRLHQSKADNTPQESEYTLKTTLNDLEKARNKLENEYKDLLKQMDELLKVKPKKLHGEELRNYDSVVMQYNTKVAEYEKKRTAYIDAVEGYHKRINKQLTDGTIDKDSFEKIFSAWVDRMIADFINEWGNPDDRFDASNHHKVYRFVVEIAPSNTRSIYLTTDSSGKIIDYRSGETKKE